MKSNKNELNKTYKDIENYAKMKGLNVAHSFAKSNDKGFYLDLEESCDWKQAIDLINSCKTIYIQTSFFNPSLYKKVLHSYGRRQPAKLVSFLSKHKNELCMVRVLCKIGDLKIQKIIQASWMDEFYSLVRKELPN